MKTLLAFDIGLKRTGVAVGQVLTKTAEPAGQIEVKNGRLDWQKLDQLIDRWQPDLIIVGDPKTQDPRLLKVINRFKHHIQQQHKITIIDVDETLTSDAANAHLTEQQLTQTQKINLRDQIAACLILQTWFNSIDK